MTTFVAIAGVGLVSYLFRVVPVLVLGHGRFRISDRVERTIRHAGAAALTALLVGAVQHWDAGGSPVAVLAATVAALALAMGGGSMLRVVAAGAAAYATIVAVGVIAW